MQDVLTAAIEFHRSGQLGQASQLYQKILASEQENPEALHLLGVLHHQQGQNSRAIELIGRAVALRPNSPIYHANLAEAYRALGDFERAAGCCRAALAIWPDYPEALSNLGAALQGLSQHAESVEHLRRALELRPDFVVAHNNLGIALRELGQKDERSTISAAPSSSTRASPRPRPTWVRFWWIVVRPRKRCHIVRKQSALTPIPPHCTTTSATHCVRWSGMSTPRPSTSRHYGSILSWQLPTATLG